jgi:signal transduction histidine kinase
LTWSWPATSRRPGSPGGCSQGASPGRSKPDAVETAALLVSELVTNAVRHGEGKIRLQVDLDDDRLFVEVIDDGRGLEDVIRGRRFENVEGWGLRIVDRSASRWGAHEGTTHVWFELERQGPRLGSEKNPASGDERSADW